jgi:hypothetical protein
MLTPAIILNSSPERWLPDPTPADPKVILDLDLALTEPLLGVQACSRLVA